MSTAYAPSQLPIAPRPILNELLSSWILRTAAANVISFAEFLAGLRLRYPETDEIYGRILDYAVPQATLRALSRFTRVPLTQLRKLDLNVRVPQISSASLLRFHGRQFAIGCPRGHSLRGRYAFCPLCLARQKRIHIQWDWCFATLIRCPVHQSMLLEGCIYCGEVDPFTFSLSGAPPVLLCRSCSANLVLSPNGLCVYPKATTSTSSISLIGQRFSESRHIVD